MIYRVGYYSQTEGHQGYSYHGSKAAAEGALDKWCGDPNNEADRSACEITTARTPKSKAEILALLKEWGSHNDNG